MANILLINLLIASFNTIYVRVSAVSSSIFNFQRFGIVMEYEEKPILPVPFIIVSHAHLAGKHLYRKIKGRMSNVCSVNKLIFQIQLHPLGNQHALRVRPEAGPGQVRHGETVRLRGGGGRRADALKGEEKLQLPTT